MANQVIVTNTGNVQVALTPPANVQVQISRAAIGTVSNVPSANFANFAGNVTGANQPNITTLGTLTALNVSGNGTINNLTVTGNLSVGNLFANNANYANFAGEAFNVSGSNVTGAVANATYANAANTANLATYATTANAVAGANVSGIVANANYSAYANIAATANSVAVANVSGIGNIAVINLDGNASNVLFGNGTFGPESGNLNANYANFAGEAFNVNASNITGTVANANYSAYAGQANTANLATFATTANAVAGANVSGTVANATFALDAGNANLANLATYATTANSVAGANVSGTVANATFALDAGNSNLANTANSVALANVVGIGNIANINLDGNASNILFGNGTFSAIPAVSNVANANYANFAGTAFSVSGSNVSGEVANANFASYANLASTANLATFATTANSVAGANVSGEVANANFASYSNIATSANSVAVGNVVGIGNIATINLDGNSSNALLGNGSFGPVEVQSTSIANGTSNINIPVANGTIAFSVNNTANLMLLENGGVVNAFPTTSAINMLRINTFGNPLSDASRIGFARARGNLTTPLSVQNNDFLSSISSFGHNGAAYQTNSVGFIRARVDNSYTANGANIPIGWQVTVNDTNGGINNQSKTHNFWANGNVTFANSVFVTDSLSATGNVTGNYIIGNGSSLTSLTGANVTGEVAFAAVANSVAGANVSGQVSNALVAGTVYTNAQPNITSLGNLPYLQVSNSANATGIVNQISSGNIAIATASANTASYLVTTTYHPNNSTAYPGQRFIRSRGNVTTPTTAVTGDRILGTSGLVYNGTVNPIGVAETWTAVGTVNANANAQWSGGQWNLTTGNPSGDTANQGNSSWQNSLVFTNSGQLQITPGTPANTSLGQSQSSILITNYGTNTTDSVVVGGITQQRARGNRDSVQPVQAGDQVGRTLFYCYSNGAYQSSNVAQYRVVVDSTYVANDVVVPMSHQFQTVANVGGVATFRTTSLYANGLASFPGDISATSGNITGGNLYTSGTLSAVGTSALGEVTAGNVNIGNISGANVTRLTLYGDKSIFSGITLNNGQYRVINDNVNPFSGFSPLSFGSFDNSNNAIPPNRFFRARGTEANAQPVVASDQVSATSYGVYADSGNTYLDTFYNYVFVTGNDGAGNVTANYVITSFNSGSNIVFTSSNTYASGNLTVGDNLSADNVSINSGGFMKLASYTEAALTAITGQIGWMAAVTDSAQGSNPNGMIAFWDTTNSRWSYVHDNSAV